MNFINLVISKIPRNLRYRIKEIIPDSLIQNLKFKLYKNTKKRDLNKIDLAFDLHEKRIVKKYGFVESDYKIYNLKEDLNQKLIDYLESLKPLKGSELVSKLQEVLDDRSQLIMSDQSYEAAYKLAKDVIKSGYELSPKDQIIKDIHQTIRENFKDYFKSPIAIINTRAWWTYSKAKMSGPLELHKDGFAPGHLKIMIYPFGLSEENGKLAIEEKLITNQSKGCCVAFKNSDVLHSGIPSQKKDRLCLEITVLRTFKPIPQYHESNFNGKHLNNPKFAYLYAQTKSNILPKSQTRFINIGSGFRDWDNWLLLDELKSPHIFRFKVSKTCQFPAFENSADFVYSSHHIEHLPQESFKKIVLNTKKVLKTNGYLLLKFPDYDYFLKSYKLNKIDSMNNKGCESIIWSWKYKNLEDNFENRLATMFCGYWNKNYGDHFSGKINDQPNSYHGPPVLGKDILKNLFINSSPHAIASFLAKEALKDPEFKSFNHQNAWSRKELIDQIEPLGFSFISSSKENIFYSLGLKTPDYWQMGDWSSYILFKSN